MARRPDWQLRFSEFAKARLAMPFAWGRNDCCLFAADAVLVMTGEDAAEPYRGYTTSREALRLMADHGGVAGLASRAWGTPVAPTRAAVGDVLLMLNGGRELLAICNGTSAVAAGKSGMVSLPMDAALSAWKI